MSYRVLDYSVDNLRICFTEQAEGHHDNLILSKQHLLCLEDYFTHIDTKTIIVEEDYVNRDFLEDYSSYYVRSFKEYKRSCVRLHFFLNTITEKGFSDILEGQPNGITVSDLQENYQGFMVLKPLPTTIIGKTCLATYEHDNRRHFPVIRSYKANLFGIQLSIDSLAYQEQDSIVAACASSSIWSAFHGTGILFQHSLPSPVEITSWATKYFPFANRHFPNKGLTGEQMAIAIREVGLEPYLYNVQTYDTLKATTYAYLKGKIPVVLGFNIWDTQNNSPAQPATHKGKHAVTITGFSIGGAISGTFENINNLTLTSSKIDKFYVHDDQMGPFARMEFQGNVVHYDNQQLPCIETGWRDSNQGTGNIKASPDIIITPLYHKIRIPFEAVLKSINFFNGLFVPVLGKVPNFSLFEWDIFLSDIRDFKKDILDDVNIVPAEKKNILVQKFPKYLWRAIGLIGNNKKIEFVFDATDIDQGSFYHSTVIYDTIVESQYKVLLHGYDSNLMPDLTTKEAIESFQ